MYDEEEGGDYSSPKTVKKSNRTVKLIGILLVILILVGGGFVLTQRNDKARALIGMKPKTEQDAAKRYLSQLGHLMIIPSDDTPVLATVEDPEALVKQQAFFQGSIKGDVVLIFPKTSRAILFSPSRDKIVNAGPVIQNGQQNTNSENLSGQ